MINVAIVGTQGVPACYGGFETLVENIIGENCSREIQYTVFCSSKDLKAEKHPENYKGARLVYLPLHANGIQSIPYDILSLIKAVEGYDSVLVLGVSGCLFLPIFRHFFKGRLIINIDGLEHRRAKWGRMARLILRSSEKAAVKHADIIIADNKGIQDYVRTTYNKEPVLIAYGGDHAKLEVPEQCQHEQLEKFGLEKKGYALSICRIEPENNCHMTLEAFAGSGVPLVFIGNWKHSGYGMALREKYKDVPDIHLLDALYDQTILYTLRINAKVYIHGHSAGGTNPSLVEAMFLGCPILCYDVVYNRATTKDKALYWKSPAELRMLLTTCGADGRIMKEIADKEYTWAHIAAQYESLYF